MRLLSTSRTRRRVSTKRRAPSRHLSLEGLEDRSLLSPFTVLNLNDSGPGSLRAAVAAANATPGANVIDFAAGLQGTIGLTSGELLITNSLTINGPGANQVSVSPAAQTTVKAPAFQVPNGPQSVDWDRGRQFFPSGR